LTRAYDAIDDERPTIIIAYTIKGIGLPFQGHKDNHAGMMTPAQMEIFQAAMGVRPQHEWDKFEGLEAQATMRIGAERRP